jgi:hypothetical protein
MSMMAAPMARPAAADRNTMIFGGIAAVAVIGLLYVAFDKDRGATPAAPEQPVVAQQQPPPPMPAPAPAIDPNTRIALRPGAPRSPPCPSRRHRQ